MCPSSHIPLAAQDEYWTDEPSFGHCSADIDVKISINLGPKTVFTNELVGKTMENKTGSPPVTRGSPVRFLENSFERDYIVTGDYFELNDLVDSGSCSSSSSNSSGLTMTSEEYFDSMALLQELQDDLIDQEMKDSSVKLNPSTPVKSKDVELHTATSVGSLRNNKECKETSKGEKRTANTSNGVNKTSSSSASENTSKEGNNEHVRRTKRRKIMKYLCFLAFRVVASITRNVYLNRRNHED